MHLTEYSNSITLFKVSKLTVKTLGPFLGLLLRSLSLPSKTSESMDPAGVLGGVSMLPVGE